MNIRTDRICKTAAEHWGIDAQITMMVEEAAELIKALCKYERDKDKSIPDYVLEEIADVEIMLQQMRYIFGGKTVDEFIDVKLKRLRRRLRKHGYEVK